MRRPARLVRYIFIWVIVPHAIRAPAFPAGSLFMSSAAAWIISAVPPLAKIELGAVGLSVTRGSMTVPLAVPSAPTVKFGMSPACGPSGFSMPCFFMSGLKWPPADAKSGPSHLAF